MAAEPAMPNITPPVDAVHLAAISERTRATADAIQTDAARTTSVAARAAISVIALQVDACRHLAAAIGQRSSAAAAAGRRVEG